MTTQQTDLTARARETIARLARLDRTLDAKRRRSVREIHDILGVWMYALPHVARAVDTLGVVESIREFRRVAAALAEGAP